MDEFSETGKTFYKNRKTKRKDRRKELDFNSSDFYEVMAAGFMPPAQESNHELDESLKRSGGSFSGYIC